MATSHHLRVPGIGSGLGYSLIHYNYILRYDSKQPILFGGG